MKRLDYIQSLGGLALAVMVLAFLGLIWYESEIFKKIIKTCFLIVVAVLIAERWNKV